MIGTTPKGFAASILLGLLATTAAQAQAPISPAISTPDRVESRLGTLEFRDGAPTTATIDKVYDNLDYTHAFEAFVNTYQGVSVAGIHKGLLSAGVKDNEVIVFSRLMDASSLFLTANADTVYAVSMLDLSNGPMVLEPPPGGLGAVNDQWFQWIIDVGPPGADRGLGGKYLIVPPGYTGPLPEGGYFIAHSKTNHVLWFARSFMVGNDPKPAADTIRAKTKIYPYEPGGVGTSIAEFLTGRVKLGQITTPPPTVFHEGTGKAFSTIPPNDFSYYEWLNEIVQNEPATAINAELMGPLAAIGIVKGKPFAPDERMKKILTEALTTANATSRVLFMNPREAEGWYYYPGSAWWNQMLSGGYNFETPIPLITPEGAKPFPPTGYRMMNQRTSFFYGTTAITPGMAMRLTGIGSAYLYAQVDADKTHLDGAKTYKVTLPPNPPAVNFWSFTVYDNQTRSMLDTPQRYPRAGSQSFPSPAAKPNADGSFTVYFGPTQPKGVARSNWIQTTPGKGWFTYLRFYGPKQPFFDKSWRPGEIELVR